MVEIKRLMGAVFGGVACFVMLLGTVYFVNPDAFTSDSFSSPGSSIILSLIFVFLAAIALIGVVGYSITRGNNIWRFNDLKKRFSKLITNDLIVRLNKLINATGIGKKIWIKRRIAPDYLPEVLRENIIILFSLSNYLKRLYIMYAKMGQVTTTARIAHEMQKVIGHHSDLKELANEIYIFRNKGQIDGTPVGWFEEVREICEYINEIVKTLKEYKHLLIARDHEKINKVFGSFASDHNTKLSELIKKLEDHLVELDNREKAFGAHMPIKAWMYLIRDQDNPYGNYEHYYKFINEGGRKIEVNYYGEKLPSKFPNLRKWYQPWKKFDPVDPDVVKTRDIDKIYDAYSLPNVSPEQVANWLIIDWRAFMNDLRFGMYKPWSKDVASYTDALTPRKLSLHALGRTDFNGDESKIPFNYGYKLKGAAFDRRALVDTGKMTYVGRKSYNDEQQNIQSYQFEKNPYPAVSSRGMSLYLPALIEMDVDDISEAQKYMQPFIQDIGTAADTASEAPDLFGPLSKEHGKGGQQNPH